MSKQARLSNWPEPCYFRSLSVVLIHEICGFVIKKDTKNKKDRKDLLALMTLSSECRLYYKDTIEGFRLRYYLNEYAEKYFDVLILAYKFNLKIDKSCYRNFVYTVVNSSDPRFIDDSHGCFSKSDGGMELAIIEEKRFPHGAYKWIEIESINPFDDGIVVYIDSQLTKMNWYDKVLFQGDEFTFIRKRGIIIEMEKDDRFRQNIVIKSSLTIEQFKRLINKEQGRKIFSIIENRSYSGKRRGSDSDD
jgi:hypothetical protein